jgi:hypothetical protein
MPAGETPALPATFYTMQKLLMIVLSLHDPNRGRYLVSQTDKASTIGIVEA